MSKRKLGEQWAEKAEDGKMHMYKCVPCSLCDLCAFKIGECQQNRGTLCKYDKCVVGHGHVIDLGILNEDGLLPCPFCGQYPKIKCRTVQPPDEYIQEEFSVVCNHYHEIDTGGYGEEQEAKDAWNRRA